jgi:Phosphotransferase enzyme family
VIRGEPVRAFSCSSAVVGSAGRRRAIEPWLGAVTAPSAGRSRSSPAMYAAPSGPGPPASRFCSPRHTDEWMCQPLPATVVAGNGAKLRRRDVTRRGRKGLRALWSTFRELPRLAPDVMSHGDLIPGNVLVADGRLAGVLDGGGFGPADPALDLVAAWHLLDDGPRAVFREHLGCDDLEWTRGAAWAFEQAMGVVWYYRESNPPMSRMGGTTLGRITAGR